MVRQGKGDKVVLSSTGIDESSSAGEFHPHALTVPDVNLSVHPAPIDRPQGARPVASEKTAKAVGF
jgi:hypothetical protein